MSNQHEKDVQLRNVLWDYVVALRPTRLVWAVGLWLIGVMVLTISFSVAYSEPSLSAINTFYHDAIAAELAHETPSKQFRMVTVVPLLKVAQAVSIFVYQYLRWIPAIIWSSLLQVAGLVPIAYVGISVYQAAQQVKHEWT